MKPELKANNPQRPTGVAVQRVVRPRFDIDQATSEAREWRLTAKKDIEGAEWTFHRGSRLRGYKDYRDGDWCVWPHEQYDGRIMGVPERLLKIMGKVKCKKCKGTGRYLLAELGGEKQFATCECVSSEWPNESSSATAADGDAGAERKQ